MGQVSRSTNLVYTGRVEMKREKSIKEGGSNEKGGSRNLGINTVESENKPVIKLKRNIQERISSDRAEDSFL